MTAWMLLLLGILCASPKLNLQLEAGIEGLCKRGGWVETLILVETDEEPLSGRVKAEIKGGKVTALMKVYIPPYARRSFRLILPSPNFPSQLQVEIESEEGERLIARKTDLYPLREQDLIFVLVSDVREDLSFIDGGVISIDRSPLARNQIIRAVTIPPQRIGSALGLADVDLIFLHSYLSDEGKIKELRRWVASGGTLITCKGFEVEGLTPAKVKRSSKPITIKIPSFFSGDLEIADVEPDGRTLLKTLHPGSYPIMVSKGLGDGTLLYIAFDPLSSSFVSPQEGERFWKRLIAYGRSPLKLYRIYDPQHRFQKKTISILGSQKGHPILYLFLPYLGAYVVILSLLVLFGRGLRSFLLLSFLISLALSIQVIFGNRVEVRRFALLRAYGGEEVAFKSEWLSVSSSFSSKVRLELRGRTIAPAMGSQHSLLLHPDRGIIEMKLTPFSGASLYAESTEELSGIGMKIGEEEVELVNDSPYDLSDLIVSGRGKLGSINYLASGVRARVKLKEDLSYQNILNLSPSSLLRRGFFESAFKEGVLNYLIEARLDFILGWMEGIGGEAMLIYRPS